MRSLKLLILSGLFLTGAASVNAQRVTGGLKFGTHEYNFYRQPGARVKPHGKALRELPEEGQLNCILSVGLVQLVNYSTFVWVPKPGYSTMIFLAC